MSTKLSSEKIVEFKSYLKIYILKQNKKWVTSYPQRTSIPAIKDIQCEFCDIFEELMIGLGFWTTLYSARNYAGNGCIQDTFIFLQLVLRYYYSSCRLILPSDLMFS